MYVHQSGVSYTLYIQNDYYANETLNIRESERTGKAYDISSFNTSLNDYLAKIEESIPELKAAKESGNIGIEVVILPKNASSTLKEAVNQTTQKMLDEGTNENILKDVLGIVKDNYSMDVESGADGVSHIKNHAVSYDLESVNNILSKFQAIYSSNGELAVGLGKFSDYLKEEYNYLKKMSSPEKNIEKSEDIPNERADLVDTFIQEMDKSKDGATTGSDELNKKLYKNYIKSLNSSLTGGLLQQHS